MQVDPGTAGADVVDEGGGGRFQSGGSSVAPTHSEALPGRRLELVGKREMDEMMRERGRGRGEGAVEETAEEKVMVREVEVDPERNEALEGEKAGEAVFRAIFGSESEGEGEG